MVARTVVLMIATSYAAHAQPEAQITSGNLFNAGKLATDAAPVPVRWEIVNSGTEPLQLGEGISTDAGLTGSWPRTSIAPGQRFVVEGTFDPKNHRSGNFVSQLQIESNARTGIVWLTAFGLAHAPGENPYYYPTTGNAATTPGKWGYINRRAEMVIQPQFDYAGEFSNGLAVFEKDKLWGYIDRTGRVVVPAVFAVNSSFQNGCGQVITKSGKRGLLDTEGRWLLRPEYESCGEAFYQDRIAVKQNNRRFIMNRKGQEIPLDIGTSYDDLYVWPNGAIQFKNNGKYGLLDREGHLLMPATYDEIMYEMQNDSRSWSGMTVVTLNKKAGAIDPQGRLTVPCKYESISYFNEGKAIAKNKGKFVIIDTQGRESAKLANYDDVGFYFTEGRAMVMGPNGRGYVDGTGHEVIAPRYQGFIYYHEGLARAKQGAAEGYIDRQGKFVIAPQFGDTSDFSEGLAAVKEGPSRPRPAPVLPPDPDVLQPGNKAYTSTFDANRKPDENNGLPLAPPTEALAVPEGARPPAEITQLAGRSPYAGAAATPPVVAAATTKEAPAPTVAKPAALPVPVPAAVVAAVVPTPAVTPLATWSGRVLDAQTKQLLSAAVVTASAGTVPGVPGPASAGAFSYRFPVGTAFSYEAKMPAYVPANATLTLSTAGLQQDILLEPLKVGVTIKLDNINFTKGLYDLLPASFVALDKLVQLMQQYPAMTIELHGHTDNTGDAQNPRPNQVLSEQRVAEVKKYLVGHGIAESRITGKGFGGRQPIASNRQEVTRKLNRRVEFKITRLTE